MVVGQQLMHCILQQKRENPFNVSGEVNHLPNLEKVILVYPYCGIATAAKKGFAVKKEVEVLMFVASKDEVVDYRKCLKWYEKQGVNFHIKIYSEAQHTFDVPPSHNRTPERFSEKYLTEMKREIIEFLYDKKI